MSRGAISTLAGLKGHLSRTMEKIKNNGSQRGNLYGTRTRKKTNGTSTNANWTLSFKTSREKEHERDEARNQLLVDLLNQQQQAFSTQIPQQPQAYTLQIQQLMSQNQATAQLAAAAVPGAAAPAPVAATPVPQSTRLP
ncbi:hypothetical protein OUZ56_017307 [Daphnia magna]|uniref:Uncharacterized protein n=1 Tax=Daphnia magna TaxID=35525 RepID=A0ABR0ASQ2_9CRUS|nr:hypothetical protein OUZ56_017307 [Daphnia magna]